MKDYAYLRCLETIAARKAAYRRNPDREADRLSTAVMAGGAAFVTTIVATLSLI